MGDMRKNSNTHFAPIPAGLELPRPESVASSLAEALKLHQAGRLADAERIYRRVLATRPDNFDSLHLLGVIFVRAVRPDDQCACARAAMQNQDHNASGGKTRIFVQEPS